MTTQSPRGLLIAILVVSSGGLIASSIQIGLMIQRPGAMTVAALSAALPNRYTDSELARLSARVTEPYNRGDVESLYQVFDDLAKNQFSRDKLAQQMATLKALVGTVESASYSGFHQIPSDGGLNLYQLNYVLRLSGAQFTSGTMQVNVVDRPGGAGIVGFFINGRAQ